MDAANYDADFDQMMSDLKNNLSFLENELDMMLLSCWVTRLSEPACALEDKARRNEYLSYLLYMLKRRTMHHPFVEEPPCGPLPPLNIDPCQRSFEEDEDTLVNENTSFYTPENTLVSEGSQDYDNKTPDDSQMPCPAGRPPPSSVESTSPDKRSPMASSTPYDPSASQRSRLPPRRNNLGQDLYTPCAPCRVQKKSILERPGGPLHSQKKKPCFKLKSKEGRAVPAGYLDSSTEVDDEPFVPSFPGTEESRQEMDKIIKSVDQCTRLFDFIRFIGHTTCDQGQLLNVIATAELAQFKEFAQSMFRARMQDTEELLSKEQLKLKERYEGWEASVMRRAQTGIRSLKRLLPDFNYQRYEKEPEYLYLMLREHFTISEGKLTPQLRNLRIKAQKKRWLTDEAERVEKENEDKSLELKELNEQLNELSKCYNAQHKDFLMRNKCLEEKAAKLRIRFHQNRKLVDSYIDELNTVPPDY